MALLMSLTLFQHLIDGFRNRDLRQQVADLLGVEVGEYGTGQMTYDLRRLRLKGLIYRPPKTNRYFVTPYGWKVARLFSRLEARVFRPAMAMFTANDAVLPFPLRQSLDRVDAQLDLLIYDAFPLPKAG
jgi:predicted MarR family transcription regulator